MVSVHAIRTGGFTKIMRKKLTLLLLSLALLVSVLTLVACGDDEQNTDGNEVVEDNTRTPISLNFYIITDERTTDEAKQLMQAAFNEVSESKYSTHVEFVFCTEAEYRETLDSHFAKIEGGEVEIPSQIESMNGEREYYVDELGQTKLKFPEIEDGQIDIVLVTGKDMLTDYVDAGRLRNLNEDLSGTFKSIRSYINTDLYNGVALNGQWYSVPNNKVLGSYNYLLINKAEAAECYLNPEDFYYTYGVYNRTAYDFERVQTLVEAVRLKNEKNEGVDGYEPKIPLLSEFDFPAAEFWTVDGTPSVFFTPYDAFTERGDYIGLVNPLLPYDTDVKNTQQLDNSGAVRSYLSYLNLIVSSREKGYTSIPLGAADDAEFAVAVMRGDYSLRKQYSDDYMVLVLDNPRLEEADMFTSMLAVTNYTRNSDRAMEIISDLTTNKELRNILQYGAKGTHFTTYTEKVDGQEITMAKRLSNDYIMNLEYTGNAFMAYPCEQDGHTAKVWIEGMLQNNEALRLPTFGCEPEYLWDTVEQAMIDSQTAMLLYNNIKKIAADNEYTIESEIMITLGTNGTTDDYATVLEEVLYGIMYRKQFADNPNLAQDEVLIENMKALVKESAYNIIAGIEAQAAITAAGVVQDAKDASAYYTSLISECETVEELESTLAFVNEDMANLAIFSNGDGKNGTPLNFYIYTYNMKVPEYTLAGALRQWWFSTFITVVE